MEKWLIYCKKADFAAISQKFNITPMLARIIRNRDVCGDEAIAEYLNGGIEDMHDPFLLDGMDEAVSLILSSINEGRKIRIIGDYDVDGVCSSYILNSYFRFLGADSDVRLPDRILEGYGMNVSMADEAFADGVSLIVTCDNGVSSLDAVTRAKELGMDIIITDHHEIPEVLPPANVIVDPKLKDCAYPFKEICGGGVAYKVVKALSKYVDPSKIEESDALLDSLLQFAGMATVADIVPMTGENRIFAREGISRLRHTENVGLRALMDARSVDMENISAYHIGFILGPCINSAGRLKNADIAYRLLESRYADEAAAIAAELSALNEERKELTIKQAAIAEEMVNEMAERGQLPKVIVLYLEDAHESVAGIIAGKIKDIFNHPVIVLTKSEDGIKGSARSIDSYNMIGEISKYPELFTRFGGHAKAAGFTLKCTPDELSKALNDNCTLNDDDLVKKVWIDMQLPFEYVTEDFVEELKLLEPFGTGNEKPLFAEKDIKVVYYNVFGKNNNVLKLRLRNKNGSTIDGIMFGSEQEIAAKCAEIENADTVSFTYYPDINEFRGTKTPQVQIRSLICHNQIV